MPAQLVVNELRACSGVLVILLARRGIEQGDVEVVLLDVLGVCQDVLHRAALGLGILDVAITTGIVELTLTIIIVLACGYK